MIFRLKLAYDIDDLPKFYWEYLSCLCEPKNAFALQARKNVIKQIQTEFYRSGTTSLILLDEEYKTYYKGFVFPKFSPFIVSFNEILGWLESNGIMERWRQTFYGFALSKVEEIGPQVLDMGHLKIGFLACLIPLILSAIIFIGEHIWSRFVVALKKERKRFSTFVKTLKILMSRH